MSQQLPLPTCGPVSTSQLCGSSKHLPHLGTHAALSSGGEQTDRERMPRKLVLVP